MRLFDVVALAIERRFGPQRSSSHAVIVLHKFLGFHGRDARASMALSSRGLGSFLASSLSGSAPATVRRHAAVLSGLLAVAREAGLKVPAGVPALTLARSRSRSRVLTDTEVDAMVALTSEESQDAGRLVRFLAETGCRVGEALSLTWQDVSAIAHRATFRETKNGQTRTVPLSDRAVHCVYCAGYQLAKPFPVSSSQLNHAWRAAKVALGVEDRDFVPHALRHTFGTKLAASGVSLPVVMRFLGHRDIKSAMRYQHAGVEDLERALDKLKG